MYEHNVALTMNDIYCSCEAVIICVYVALVVSMVMVPLGFETARCHNCV